MSCEHPLPATQQAVAGLPLSRADQPSSTSQPKLFCYSSRIQSQAGSRHSPIWPKNRNKTQGCGRGSPRSRSLTRSSAAQGSSSADTAETHQQLTGEAAAGNHAFFRSA